MTFLTFFDIFYSLMIISRSQIFYDNIWIFCNIYSTIVDMFQNIDKNLGKYLNTMRAQQILVTKVRIWEGVKLYENVMCRSLEDLLLLIQEALRIGHGVLVRVFSSEDGSVYLHLLFDEEKLLLAEAVFIRTWGRLKGEMAVRYFLGLIGTPVVVDVYSLGDLDVKRTLLANLDLYKETPHVLLFELFTPKLWQSSPTSLKSELVAHSLE